MTSASPILPGKLGDPAMVLATDPRADPRLVAALAPIGLDQAPPDPGVSIDSSSEVLVEYGLVAEEGFDALAGIFTGQASPIEDVEHETVVITGLDDNDVTLYLHRPTNVDGPIPCVLHTHGGGMVILEASNLGYVRWRDELAATGMLVVGVEFRNGGGKLGPHPFPAGQNDCVSALKWILDSRAELNFSKLIISGESGGGNLAITTTMRAMQAGLGAGIDGVYAQCPYISGLYATKDPALPSLYENDDYFLNCGMMGAMVRMYSPDGSADTDPMAWPYHASIEQLTGFPPTVISVNELDPLRDEGLAFFRKLLAAKVQATSRTINGTSHAADCIFRDALPDVYLTTIRDIYTFATNV